MEIKQYLFYIALNCLFPKKEYLHLIWLAFLSEVFSSSTSDFETPPNKPLKW